MNFDINLVGQLFVFGFDGLSLPNKAKDLLIKDNLSGVTLFKRNIESLDQLINLNSQIINFYIKSKIKLNLNIIH